MFDFPMFITARRRELGINKSELARRAGVHRTTVYNLENDVFSARLDVLEAILGAMGYELCVRRIEDENG